MVVVEATALCAPQMPEGLWCHCRPETGFSPLSFANNSVWHEPWSMSEQVSCMCTEHKKVKEDARHSKTEQYIIVSMMIRMESVRIKTGGEWGEEQAEQEEERA